MKHAIRIVVDGRQVFAESGTTLSRIVKGEAPCGGHGKCGKCKVIARGDISQPTASERRLLSKEALARGIRLACLTRALGDCEIQTLAAARESQIAIEGILPRFKPEPTFSNYGVAMDIGTTTLAARLYNPDGRIVAETSRLNPQSAFGADVISRIEAAINGSAEQLAREIRNALNEMLSEFASVTDLGKIDSLVITGNTVMLSLLTEQSLVPFSHAPFHAERLFGETLTAEALSLSRLAPNTLVYLPPCISAFVGADITCAILATDLCNHATAMLADIGTNGEMALWHGGKLTVCSTAAGPAFEGVGISMGMQGKAGAIDRVQLKDGRLTAHVIGDQMPIGICGSGLVDAVACLLEAGTIDETGYLPYDTAPIAADVVLVQKDLRMLQLAKSAICAGLQTLMDTQKIKASAVSPLYIAGGFGNYLNIESAVKIGLLPKGLRTAACTVGNAAISGAAMMLLNASTRTAAEAIARDIDVLDLSTNPVFSEHYMTGMLFEEQ